MDIGDLVRKHYSGGDLASGIVAAFVATRRDAASILLVAVAD